MRIDKLLWFLRLAKTRAIAQAIAEAGHIRLNGRRVERAHHLVRPGDVLTVPLGAATRVIAIESIPPRRGPASEARACYRDLTPPAAAASDPGRPLPAAEPPVSANASQYPRED